MWFEVSTFGWWREEKKKCGMYRTLNTQRTKIISPICLEICWRKTNKTSSIERDSTSTSVCTYCQKRIDGVSTCVTQSRAHYHHHHLEHCHDTEKKCKNIWIIDCKTFVTLDDWSSFLAQDSASESRTATTKNSRLKSRRKIPEIFFFFFLLHLHLVVKFNQPNDANPRSLSIFSSSCE